MKTIAARDAKNHFGSLIDDARTGPILVERNGRRAAIVLAPDKYDELVAAQDALWEARASEIIANSRPLSSEREWRCLRRSLLTLRIFPEATKFIASVGGKQAGQISIKIFNLLKNPLTSDSEALKGTGGGFRRVVEEAVKIPLVGRRNDDEIYKQVKRKGL